MRTERLFCHCNDTNSRRKTAFCTKLLQKPVRLEESSSSVNFLCIPCIIFTFYTQKDEGACTYTYHVLESCDSVKPQVVEVGARTGASPHSKSFNLKIVLSGSREEKVLSSTEITTPKMVQR